MGEGRLKPRYQEDISGKVVERRPEVHWETRDGLVTLRRRKTGPLRSRLLQAFGISPDLTVHLDALGSAVWHAIDGTRTVGEVLTVLTAAHPDEARLNLRLGQYLSTLASNRFIRLR